MGHSEAARTGLHAHLDVEVGRVAEHGPDGVRLRLHVHLLDLSGLEGLVSIRLLLVLSESGGKRSFRRLEGGAGQARYRSHDDVREYVGV